jgi:hypothetical protein
MTVDALRAADFPDRAAQVAGAANAAVDDKQGNSSGETNLHAMCGLGQPDFDCRKGVAKVIADGKQDIIDAIVKRDYKLALRRIGETLHTVQDLAFHKYEPWPFRGISDAFLNDPNYMICHAIRDLGLVAVSNVVDVSVSWRVSQQVYVGVTGFYHPANNYFFRVPGPGAGPPTIPGFGGLFTINIGAAPNSVQVRNPFQDSRGATETQYSSMLSSGRADLTRAEDETKKFIGQIQTDVEAKPPVNQFPAGPEMWRLFKGFNPS